MYIKNKLKAFKSIMFLMYHSELSGCGVSGRRCTVLWITLIGMMNVVQNTKRCSQRKLLSCNRCVGVSCFSSTITITGLWHIGLVEDVWTRAGSSFMLHSASSTTKSHFNPAGMHQQLTKSLFPDSSLSREALYHVLVAYAISILWTECNKLYELLASCIEKKSPELQLRCTKCILHHWDNTKPGSDQRSLWSWQIFWNTKQCDSVAPLLALHSTQPSYKGSWFLVEGFSLFA